CHSELRLWDMVQCREIRRLAGGEGWVGSVALAPDGRTALSAIDDQVHLWDLTSGQQIRSFGEREYPIYSLAFSTDGLLALTGASGGSMRLWDVQTGKDLLLFDEGHSATVHSVALSPDGCRALSAGGDGTTKLWNVQTGEELFSIPFASDGLAFS